MNAITILTEVQPNGLEQYWLVENGVRIDGPFWFVSHLIKRAAEYGVEVKEAA